MKLYLISQCYNDYYDTYDSAVVAALSPKEAQHMQPQGKPSTDNYATWAPPEHVSVEYVGTAKVGTKSGTVICASFNAG